MMVKYHQLSKVDHHGLVYLEHDESHRACILSIGRNQGLQDVLLFLDPWRGYPKFGYVCLAEDVYIRGRLGTWATPMTPGLGRVRDEGIGEARCGAIFRMGHEAVLWVNDPDGGLSALPLHISGSGDAGFHHFHWWVLGEPMADDVLPAAVIQSLHPALDGSDRPECYESDGWKFFDDDDDYFQDED